MSTLRRRQNEALASWLRAAGTAGATYLGLTGLHFTPVWGALALALTAGALTLLSSDLGILAALAALTMPLLAAAPVVGIAFAVVGLIGLRYLGSDGGRPFYVIAASLAGAALGPAWAAVGIAGFALGPGEAALAAAAACLVVEAFGLVLGEPMLGVVVSGGTEPALRLAEMPETLFGPWLGESFGRLGSEPVERLLATLGGAEHTTALLAQPLAWAVAAAAAGGIAQLLRRAGRPGLAPAGAAVGVMVAVAGSSALRPLHGLGIGSGTLAAATAESLLVALVAAFAYDRLFPHEIVEAPQPPVATMATEDADVDELLRLIATAEDKLSSQHTTVKTVMITDMKSFSRMAEEDGSMITAKAIQRHRDLLLPIIEAHAGHGKSTGGDGIVAAFDEAADAIAAAAEMQAALARHNAAHAAEREMTVRIGIADGEVVLDKGGRPFIGTALNLAARVMNLADGGQTFSTSTVSAQARGRWTTHSHGQFALKNISAPVEVVEVLWADGQMPLDPRQRLSA